MIYKLIYFLHHWYNLSTYLLVLKLIILNPERFSIYMFWYIPAQCNVAKSSLLSQPVLTQHNIIGKKSGSQHFLFSS